MSDQQTNRREFLVDVGSTGAVSILAASGVASASGASDQTALAINGGPPVRRPVLHSRPYGPQF